jgi:phospholipid/cholesterol/gamma-HCH transport system substrate-binding protein
MKRRDEVAVGILVTVAVAVLILGVLWLARGGLSSGYLLHTRFSWGQNLKQGQPVLLAGVNVGYVDNVELKEDGFLSVMMRVNDQYHVPKGTVASVKAVGFFGDVAVALTPVLGAKAEVFLPGDTIPAGPPEASVEQLMERVDSIAVSLGTAMKVLNTELVATGGLRDLRKALATTATFATQLQNVLEEQNKNLTQTFAEFQRTARSFALDSAKLDSTVTNFRAASETAKGFALRLDTTATRLHAVLERVSRGDGTVGKLLTDSLLYQQAKSALASFDSLLTDIRKNPRKYINIHIF